MKLQSLPTFLVRRKNWLLMAALALSQPVGSVGSCEMYGTSLMRRVVACAGKISA